MRVLLVSQDLAIVGSCTHVMQERGHEVIQGQDRSAAWALVRSDIDIVLYDLCDAGKERWRELAQWRRMTPAPLIALGSHDDENTIIRALKAGADDYMGQPFNFEEMLARIEALVRRAHMGAHSIEQPTGIHLDAQASQVNLNGQRIDLTPTEFQVLRVLVEHAGDTVPRDELIRRVWHRDRSTADTNLSLYIWHLRQKLEPNPDHPRLIVTRWGVGYAFRGCSTLATSA